MFINLLNKKHLSSDPNHLYYIGDLEQLSGSIYSIVVVNFFDGRLSLIDGCMIKNPLSFQPEKIDYTGEGWTYFYLGGRILSISTDNLLNLQKRFSELFPRSKEFYSNAVLSNMDRIKDLVKETSDTITMGENLESMRLSSKSIDDIRSKIGAKQ